MLPGNTSSSVPIDGLYLQPDDFVTTPLVDYERGGIALNDSTQGLLYQNWKAYLDVYSVQLVADNMPSPVTLFEGAQITELSLCFDQNMRWSVGYIQAGILKLNWYDSSVNARVISEFGDGAVNPKMALDDKRPTQNQSSDMILAYLRGTSLFYRQQRDRFLIEYTLKTGLFPKTKLKNIGMNRNLRMQFELV